MSDSKINNPYTTPEFLALSDEDKAGCLEDELCFGGFQIVTYKDGKSKRLHPKDWVKYG